MKYTWQFKIKHGYDNADLRGNNGDYQVCRPLREDGASLWHFLWEDGSDVRVVVDWFRVSLFTQAYIVGLGSAPCWVWAKNEDEAKLHFHGSSSQKAERE